MANNVVGVWSILYKVKNTGEWKRLIGQKGYWYADPILFSYNNSVYLFTEAFDEKIAKGKIAISRFNEDNMEFATPKIIIDKPYHLSYPEVFEINGKIYMIPETSQNRTLELYEAMDDSLDKWEKKKVLLKDCFLADTTILKADNDIYLYSYEERTKEYTTVVYQFDKNELKLLQINSNTSLKNDKRPAGNFLRNQNGKFIRPTQFNINMYGEKIIFEEIKPGESVGNKTNREISISDLIKEGAIDEIEEFYKIHTYNECENIVVVDVLKDEIDRFATLRSYIRRGRNFVFRIIKD